MIKHKVYVEESFIHEIEIECDNEEDIEDIIKDKLPNITVAQGHIPNTVQYMVEDEDGMQSGWMNMWI